MQAFFKNESNIKRTGEKGNKLGIIMRFIFNIFTIISGLLFMLYQVTDESFREKQKQYSRVKVAYDEKYDLLMSELESIGINDFNMEIFIRAFKQEQILEVWVHGKDSSLFMLFKEYAICQSSGKPGPKRREGDLQVPEGFYRIRDFNPYSNFYLSLGIDYPNRSDRILCYQPAPGGDIYIHGSCVTIGCIPVTDDKIKELYVLAVEARANGQDNIMVHIYPSALSGESWDNLNNLYFDNFESNYLLPEVSVSSNGDYIITDAW
jgi:murein L,D-transpeptidase YafK